MAVTWTELVDQGDILGADRWKIYFSNVPGGGDGKALSILCDHVTLPQPAIGHVRARLFGFPRAWAGGVATENTFSASFIEKVNGANIRSLTGWQQMARERRNLTGTLKSSYALAQVKLEHYDTTGAVAVRYKATMVFPLTIGLTEFAEESAAAHYEVQFSMDDLDIETRAAAVAAVNGGQA